MMNRNYSNPTKLNTNIRRRQQTRKASLNSWLGATGFIEDFGKTVLRNCVRLHGPPGGGEPYAGRMRGGEPTASSNKSAAGKQRNSIRNKTMNIRGNTEIRNAKSFETHAHSTMGATKMNTRKIRSGLANQGRLFVSALALATVPLGVTPALADITNTATVNGTFNAGNVSDTSVQIDVPVTAATRDLDISKTVETVASLALGTNTSATDGGDTIVYRFTVTNSGNVTETNIDIIENTPTFDGVLGTGSFISAPTEVGGGTGTAASLGPSETVIFEATYELSDADAFRAAAAADPTISVVNTATADSDLYTMPPGDADTAITGVLPVASLVIAKSYTFQFDPDTNSTADVGDEILYSYQITNNGNVPVTAISISDDHENGEAHQEFFDSSGFLGPLGTSPGEWNITIDTADTLGLNSDDAADGSFETLGANGVITFTYAHEVTQEEFDAQ